jgi:hypothetical protein
MAQAECLDSANFGLDSYVKVTTSEGAHGVMDQSINADSFNIGGVAVSHRIGSEFRSRAAGWRGNEEFCCGR